MFRVIAAPEVEGAGLVPLDADQKVICDRFGGLRGVLLLLVRGVFEPLRELVPQDFVFPDGMVVLDRLKEGRDFGSFRETEFSEYQADIRKCCELLRGFFDQFFVRMMQHSDDVLATPFLEIRASFAHIEMLATERDLDLRSVSDSFLRVNGDLLQRRDFPLPLGRILDLLDSEQYSDEWFAGRHFLNSDFTYDFMTRGVVDEDGDLLDEGISAVLCRIFPDKASFDRGRGLLEIQDVMQTRLTGLVSYCQLFRVCQGDETAVFDHVVLRLRELLCLRNHREGLMIAIRELFPGETLEDLSSDDLIAKLRGSGHLGMLYSYGQMLSFLVNTLDDGFISGFYSEGRTIGLNARELQLIVREGLLFCFGDNPPASYAGRGGLNEVLALRQTQALYDIESLKDAMWDAVFADHRQGLHRDRRHRDRVLRKEGAYLVLRIFNSLLRPPKKTAQVKSPELMRMEQRMEATAQFILLGMMSVRLPIGPTIGSLRGALGYPGSYKDLFMAITSVGALTSTLFLLNGVGPLLAGSLIGCVLPHMWAHLSKDVVNAGAFLRGMSYHLTAAVVPGLVVGIMEMRGWDRETIARVLPVINKISEIGVMAGTTFLTGGGLVDFILMLVLFAPSWAVNGLLNRVAPVIRSVGIEDAVFAQSLLRWVMMFGFHYLFGEVINEFGSDMKKMLYMSSAELGDEVFIRDVAGRCAEAARTHNLSLAFNSTDPIKDLCKLGKKDGLRPFLHPDRLGQHPDLNASFYNFFVVVAEKCVNNTWARR